MSLVTVNRIASVLERDFSGKIDMSEWVGRPEPDTRIAFLSRALAALCVKYLAGTDADTAAASVTDGFGDGGIDALYFDQAEDVFYFAQSKWSKDGTSPLNGDGSSKFIEGVTNILSGDAGEFAKFNDKIKRKEAEIRSALYSERDVRLCLVTAHNAEQPIAAPARHRVDQCLATLNNPIKIATANHFDQAGIYKIITAESRHQQITLDISLREFGVIEKPHLSYYGRVHVLEVADWWKRYGPHLLSRNLRLFFPFGSDVNAALSRTVREEPDNFWYFNNGITIICDSIKRKLAGLPKKDLGLFQCENVSVVNGAQTVGTIGTSITDSDVGSVADSALDDSWVQVRIISLEKSGDGFDGRITRATNFQNSVRARDFAAMDPIQHRLAIEFALDRRKYVYKSGEDDPKFEDGCSLTEATQALGCAISMDLAVQVKRNLGELWSSTTAPPYTKLFNDKTTSGEVWRAVQIMRGVDEELQKLRNSTVARSDMICTHLNRVILNLVFQHESVRGWRDPKLSDENVVRAAREPVARLFGLVGDYLEKNHKTDYLGVFFKNTDKCNALAVSVMSKKPLGERPTDLFGNPTNG